ncbi:hypothetical protein GDO86_012688 [Hymenochirus boettgeri]|uniref:UBZ2-type domain-containing protein n=1 Tax=Hymenochirus boettgeri TaxID=247094 RepID=A0A8T2ITR8_9PIPI|nr:hypothetical protein GDO86_012688 [Hymenochirus boettgeri]
MSDERTAKLKLRKRKDSTAQAIQRNVSIHSETAASVKKISSGSWLYENDLTCAEQMWRQVLKATFPDFHNIGWHAVTALPDINSKNIKKEQNREIFEVGGHTFEWSPFPSVSCIQMAVENKNKCSPSIVIEEQNRSQPAVNTATASVKQLFPTHNADNQTILNECNVFLQTKKHILNSGSEENVNYTGTAEKQPKSSFFRKKKDKMNHLSQVPKTEKLPFQTKTQTNDIIMKDTETEIRSGSPLQPQLLESTNTTPKMSGTLENCPMCLKPFPKRFSQLEIDSHLAQCLSETTVDVIW